MPLALIVTAEGDRGLRETLLDCVLDEPVARAF
jgi:hypothetical protein